MLTSAVGASRAPIPSLAGPCVPNVIGDARGSGGWQVHFGMSHDIDVHAARLQRWRQDYDQLTAGTFSGQLDQVWSDVAQVFRERSNQALRQRCEVWTD